ncbi:MAG TPA: M17 family peptidase N-terminal domain-containing protein, partial [Acidimicrobiales bacterium]
MSISFTAAKAAPAEATVLAVPVFAGLSQPDGVELDARYLEAVGFEAKPGQAHSLLADDGGTVVAVGLGDPGKVTAETFRKAGAAVAKAAWRSTDVAVALAGAAPDAVAEITAARAVVEGIGLGSYRYGAWKSSDKPCRIERVAVVGRSGRLQAALDAASVVVEAVCLARDLVNEPAGALTPTRLGEQAVAVAERAGLGVRVLGPDEMRAERMGALLGVAQGSD